MAKGNREPEDERPIQKERAKKPYSKPAFRFERVFETTALRCGKIQTTQFQCRLNRKTS